MKKRATLVLDHTGGLAGPAEPAPTEANRDTVAAGWMIVASSPPRESIVEPKRLLISASPDPTTMACEWRNSLSSRRRSSPRSGTDAPRIGCAPAARIEPATGLFDARQAS